MCLPSCSTTHVTSCDWFALQAEQAECLVAVNAPTVTRPTVRGHQSGRRVRNRSSYTDTQGGDTPGRAGSVGAHAGRPSVSRVRRGRPLPPARVADRCADRSRETGARRGVPRPRPGRWTPLRCRHRPHSARKVPQIRVEDPPSSAPGRLLSEDVYWRQSSSLVTLSPFDTTARQTSTASAWSLV
jgi:hypothetical protein